MVSKLNIANTSLKKALPHPLLGINLWSQNARAKVITQVVDKYGNVNDEVFFFDFDGVIQPLDPEEIKVKPEGQWSWYWWCFHTRDNLQLKTNDRVYYRGVEYKIMNKKDYGDYGHIEYHCIKDWQGNAD